MHFLKKKETFAFHSNFTDGCKASLGKKLSSVKLMACNIPQNLFNTTELVFQFWCSGTRNAYNPKATAKLSWYKKKKTNRKYIINLNYTFLKQLYGNNYENTTHTNKTSY